MKKRLVEQGAYAGRPIDLVQLTASGSHGGRLGLSTDRRRVL